MSSEAFRGDVVPRQAWEILQGNGQAVLLDVRTQPEWLFVGQPDLSGLGRQVVPVQWQVYPSMARNPNFVTELIAKGVAKDAPVLVICRSGARSRAAAEFLAENGFTELYNVAEGFEGNLGQDGHRGHDGWKGAQLPWKQG
ncbi:MAG: rhodanese-like domain-containing protein [Rhodospirillales bacterium]|nr:rhodanese-like domain-containing protein [Rhodospirillales bacterium]